MDIKLKCSTISCTKTYLVEKKMTSLLPTAKVTNNKAHKNHHGSVKSTEETLACFTQSSFLLSHPVHSVSTCAHSMRMMVLAIQPLDKHAIY